MFYLTLTGLLFLATHLVPTNTPLRSLLIHRISERGYLILYSLVALASFIAFILAYNDAPRFDYWWTLNPALYWVPKIAMLPAFIMLVGGIMGIAATSSLALPGCAKDEAALAKLSSGMNRVTRHPVQWAIVLWAASHLAANGDLVSVVFFGVFLLLSWLGCRFTDGKKAVAFGEDWNAFAAVTSNLPFAAIAAGRNKLVLKEMAIPAAVGVALYLILFWGHEWVAGVGLYWQQG